MAYSRGAPNHGVAPKQRPQSILALTTALVLACGCAGAGKPQEASAPRGAVAPARPWTASFMERALLTARVVRIVGPKGLLEHVVVVQDSDNHLHSVAAVSEGLRIEERQKPDGDGSPIRAQLDNLVIAAEEGLLVVESVNATQVVVEAEGDAYWCVVGSGSEQRAATLRLVGEDPH